MHQNNQPILVFLPLSLESHSYKVFRPYNKDLGRQLIKMLFCTIAYPKIIKLQNFQADEPTYLLCEHFSTETSQLRMGKLVVRQHKKVKSFIFKLHRLQFLFFNCKLPKTDCSNELLNYLDWSNKMLYLLLFFVTYFCRKYERDAIVKLINSAKVPVA